MNMTGMSTQGGMMGNSMGMLGFGNSAAAIPMRPGVNPMRNMANTGALETMMRNQIQSIPKGSLTPDLRPMMQTPVGGNGYVTGGNLGSSGQSFIAGNMGGLVGMGGMGPLGESLRPKPMVDPMVRKKIF
jgi:hypothetical protein